MSKFVFGPVSSRRLGRSLGIDPVPFKTCTFDCPYCELGHPTDSRTCERQLFFPVETILGEVQSALRWGPKPEVLTVSGSGEPTLYKGLGELFGGLRRLTNLPVALLTNGSLFFDPEVRAEAAGFDLILPSLDTGREETWRRLNRPHPDLKFEAYLQGLEAMARERRGRYLLEIMVVRGINDCPEEVSALRERLAVIRPDGIQLNTVARPPLEENLNPVSREILDEIADRLKVICPVEIISERPTAAGSGDGSKGEEQLLALLARRPITLGEAAGALNMKTAEVTKLLNRLLEEKKVAVRRDPRGGTAPFYVAASGKRGNGDSD